MQDICGFDRGIGLRKVALATVMLRIYSTMTTERKKLASILGN